MLGVALALILSVLVLLTIGVWAVAANLDRLARHHELFPAPDAPAPSPFQEGMELWINGVGMCTIAGVTDAGLPVAEPREPGVVVKAL